MKNQNQKTMEVLPIKTVECKHGSAIIRTGLYAGEFTNLEILLDFLKGLTEYSTLFIPELKELKIIAKNTSSLKLSRAIDGDLGKFFGPSVTISIRTVPLITGLEDSEVSEEVKDEVDQLFCDSQEVCESSFVDNIKR